jgi:hypothetical protein
VANYVGYVVVKNETKKELKDVKLVVDVGPKPEPIVNEPSVPPGGSTPSTELNGPLDAKYVWKVSFRDGTDKAGSVRLDPTNDDNNKTAHVILEAKDFTVKLAFGSQTGSYS